MDEAPNCLGLHHISLMCHIWLILRCKFSHLTPLKSGFIYQLKAPYNQNCNIFFCFFQIMRCLQLTVSSIWCNTLYKLPNPYETVLLRVKWAKISLWLVRIKWVHTCKALRMVLHVAKCLLNVSYYFYPSVLIWLNVGEKNGHDYIDPVLELFWANADEGEGCKGIKGIHRLEKKRWGVERWKTGWKWRKLKPCWREKTGVRGEKRDTERY